MWKDTAGHAGGAHDKMARFLNISRSRNQAQQTLGGVVREEGQAVEGHLRQTEGLEELVLHKAPQRRLAAGATFCLNGQLTDQLYCVMEGALAVSIAPASSGPHITHLAFPGDWKGASSLLSGQPERLEAEACTNTVLLVPSMAKVRQIVRTQSGAIWARKLAAAEFAIANRTFADLLIPWPAQRLAATIARAAQDRAMVLPITQERLATMSNVSRRLANQTLQHFRSEGWIEIGYGFFHVLRPLDLLAYARGKRRPAPVRAYQTPIVPPVTTAGADVCNAGLGT